MSKLKTFLRYPAVWLFGLFLAGFTAADLLKPAAAFSDFENRYLKQLPKPTVQTIFDGSFAQNYETYLNDQFILRNNWISLKSHAESALLKVENNGIVYGSGGQMFEKYPSYSAAQLEKNLGFLSTFLEANPGAMLTIIPSAYEIYPEKLPIGLKQVNQKEIIDDIYQMYSNKVETLDLYPVLTAGKDGEIYYRTDHHWTTDGAYLAYLAYCAAKDLTPVDLSDLGAHLIPDFYGTYFNKCKNTTISSDTLVWYDIPMESVTVDGEEKANYLDELALASRDKYGAFLWGNHGVTILKGRENLNPSSETTRLLLIKDSYANCFAPFLTYNYDEVWIVDLRSFPKGMTDLVKENDFTDILFLYNFMNFASDTNFYRLNY